MILIDRIINTTLPNSVIQPENTPVPEFIDPVFAKQLRKARFQSLKMSVLGLFSRKRGLKIRALSIQELKSGNVDVNKFVGKKNYTPYKYS